MVNPSRIIIKSLPDGHRWKVTRDGNLVGYYPFQRAAEQAAARLGRSAARDGLRAVAILHKGDGTPKRERTYSKVQAPWLGIRN
jgi:hypothetical protein